jgi:hypothetical protein
MVFMELLIALCLNMKHASKVGTRF